VVKSEEYSGSLSRYTSTTLGCSVCGEAAGQANAELCPSYERVLDNARLAFEAWANAFGSIGLEFLKRISRLQGTGRNAREIAEFVQKHPEKWK